MAVSTSTRVPSTKVYLEPGDATTCLAGAAVTAGHFVKVTTGGVGNHPKVIHATAAADHVYGVAHTDAASGAEVSVLRMGTVGVITGEAVSSGDLVCSGAAGVAMKVVNIATTPAVPGRAYGVVTADTDNAASAPVTLVL